MNKPSLLLAALLFSAPAAAQEEELPSLEGSSRISLSGGWRYTPNDLFRTRLVEAGYVPGRPSPGGPVLTGVFGYSINDVVEVAIDLLAGGEQLQLQDADTLTSITYGGLIGLRFQSAIGRFIPSIGFQTGGILSNVDGPKEGSESVIQAFAITAGLNARLSAQWGVGLEYRFMLARGGVPEIGSINAGGNWVTLGVTYFFPPDGKPTRGLPSF